MVLGKPHNYLPKLHADVVVVVMVIAPPNVIVDAVGGARMDVIQHVKALVLVNAQIAVILHVKALVLVDALGAVLVHVLHVRHA